MFVGTAPFKISAFQFGPQREATMAEIRTVTTLRRIADEIRVAIHRYEQCLNQSCADLAHVAAAIAIFAGKRAGSELPAYTDFFFFFLTSMARATPPTSAATAKERVPAASSSSPPRPRPWSERLTAKRVRRKTGTS